MLKTQICVTRLQCVKILYRTPDYARHRSKYVALKERRRWAGNTACRGERRGVYRVLVGKPKGKRLLGRPTPRWLDNIEMDLQKVGWGQGLG